MAQTSDRLTRVNELLKREIADAIEKHALNESGMLVSVTRVRTAESLRNATVYVSIFGADDARAEAVLKKLARLKTEIQQQIARHVILKYTPVLCFVRDMNLAEGDRVLALIRELEEQE